MENVALVFDKMPIRKIWCLASHIFGRFFFVCKFDLWYVFDVNTTNFLNTWKGNMERFLILISIYNDSTLI
jgi:hypothetical protein